MPVRKEKKSRNFFRGILIYAGIGLLLIGGGLVFFWNYMAAYEHSRPMTVAAAYLQQHPLEMILETEETLFPEIDSSIESAEYCRAYVKAQVTDSFSCLKNPAESTEERLAFTIRSGKQTTGKLYLTANGQDRFGFTQWQVSEAHYDFSYLLGEPLEVVVPATSRVQVNGTQLQDKYLVEENIHFPLLEEFYDSYSLPTLVRYRVEYLLGNPEVVILDGAGNTCTQQTDPDAYLKDCTGEDEARVEEITNKFLKGYVRFCGSGPSTVRSNFSVVAATLVPNGTLIRRLRSAISGMEYAQSGGDKIDSVTVHRTVPLGEGRFLCDVTYVVSTKGKKGVVQTTTHMKVIAAELEKGLRIEAMTQY